MKQFEIITEEDCIDGKLYFPEVKHLMSGIQLANHAEYGPPWIRGPWISLEDANKLIQEKGQVGYTEMEQDDSFAVSPNRSNYHRLELFYITRPLEAVGPECDHDFCSFENGRIKRLEHTHNIAMVEGIDYTANFCPKCGKDLAKIGGSDD